MSNMSAQQKPRMGRPPTVGTGETVMATVRLTPEQDKAIRKAAKKQKKERSEWMRSVLFEAAKAVVP